MPVVIFFLLLFLDRFKFDSHTLFMHAVRNLGHVPLFGLIAVILLWILQLTLGGRLGAIHRYILAWIGAAGLGEFADDRGVELGSHGDVRYVALSGLTWLVLQTQGFAPGSHRVAPAELSPSGGSPSFGPTGQLSVSPGRSPGFLNVGFTPAPTGRP